MMRTAVQVKMAGALEGVRIVDFTQGAAGPYASMLVAFATSRL
jgi:crotonobetainyl-CoA:carnitine CoA-transferase CaiB-like acyl-CoA transferase